MTKKIKRSLKYILFTVAMLAFSALFISYLNGDFVLPFVSRPTLYDYESAVTQPSNTPDATEPVATSAATEPPAQSAISISAFFSSLESTKNLESEGYMISDARYKKDVQKLALLDSEGVASEYSLTSSQRSLDSITGKEPVSVTEEIPAYHPRMGYIFRYNSDGTVSLLNSMCSVILDVIPDTLTFVGERDLGDHPVFYDSAKKKYVFYYSATKEWLDSTYNPQTDVRGIHFDYPSYYGKGDNVLHRVKVGEYYGYGTSETSLIVQAVYSYGYEFRENYCTVTSSKNKLFVFNNAGSQKFYEYTLFRPENDEIENLGYYYFEFGVMRARVYNAEKGVDYEVFLKTNESELPIPSGYTVKSYSDGMILLEKDGLYGYMNYGGKWICDPVFTAAKPFVEGLAVVTDASGKSGVIDRNGAFVIPCIFDKISNMSGGAMSLYADGKFFIINKVQK